MCSKSSSSFISGEVLRVLFFGIVDRQLPAMEKARSDYYERRQEHLLAVRHHIDINRPDTETTPKLTSTMRQNHFEILCQADFERVRERFGKDCEEGILTYDSESLRLNGSLDSILLGGMSGACYDFSIRDLKREVSRQNSDQQMALSHVLPQSVVDALRDPSIMKLGSKAWEDAEDDYYKYELVVEPVYEMQALYPDAEEDVFPRRDNRNHAYGIGSVSYSLYKADFKPRSKNRPSAWARYMHYTLYDWHRPLTSYARLYRHLDSQVPIVLVSKIAEYLLQHHLVSKSLVSGPLKNLRKAVLSHYQAHSLGVHRRGTQTFFDAVVSQDPGDTREARVMEHRLAESGEVVGRTFQVQEETCSTRGADVPSTVDERTRQRNETVKRKRSTSRAAKKRRSHSDRADDSEELQLHPNRDDLAIDDERNPDTSETETEALTGGPEKKEWAWQTTSRDLEFAKNHLMCKTSGSYYRNVNERKGRRGMVNAFKKVRRNQAKTNKFRDLPTLDKMCLFCGSSTHSKRFKHGDPMCGHFKQNLVQRVKGGNPKPCNYPLCENPDCHQTEACVTLMNRCKKCRHRGHIERDCREGDPAGQEEQRKLFEEHAKNHCLLKKRFEVSSLGFHNVRASCGAVSYKLLLSLPVADAREFLDVLAE